MAVTRTGMRKTGTAASLVTLRMWSTWAENNVPATDEVCRDSLERNPVRIPSDGEYDALSLATMPDLYQLLVSVAVESDLLVSPTVLSLITSNLKHLHRAAR